ncbi:hypothetical protein D1B31_03765 [Neobacillus notoginsengisoli]|uniref:Uncharacterized protein n=1 Tax=Neobacillus notoginsengisoli TaxID=1578198 RepID=A0A417YYM7_9BACI|nr:hypothetical protein [Neobacillus notoginsengisoli]RHW42713.1 hypothetical protein D1B31_03765 [Neobacillus notoginsengisoli]
MKNFLSAILPGIVILLFIWFDSHFPESKYILVGIYLLFPLLFIIQGYYSASKGVLILGFIISVFAIMIPISIWYNMGSLLPAIVVYLLLGIGAYYLSGKTKG